MNLEALRRAQIRREVVQDGLAQQKHLQGLLAMAEEGSTQYGRAQAVMAQLHGLVKEQLQMILAGRTGSQRANFKKWVGNLDMDRAAFLALHVCISRCLEGQGKTPAAVLAYHIGIQWQYEENVQHVAKADPIALHDFEERELGYRRTGRLRKVCKAVLGGAYQDRERPELIKFGQFGLLALWHSGIIDIPRQVKRKEQRMAVMRPDYLKTLVDFNNADVLHVWARQEGRMWAPPDVFTNAVDGGYLTRNRKLRTPLIRLHGHRAGRKQELLETMTAENMPKVFGAVNYLQSIAYEIHQPTRRAILETWAKGGGVLDVPATTIGPAPQYPERTDGMPEDVHKGMVVDYKVAAALYHKKRIKWEERLRIVKNLLKASGDVGRALWFPMFLDSRGRMYYRGTPNPQGDGMSKGFLHFREKKSLGKDGLFWLKVHIANSWGYDKERMADRAAWVDREWPAIERALDAPWDYPEALGDTPWCTFSAAWELREAYRSGDPEAYCTGIPVGMDATCSGQQHYSAMLLDETGGELVNLTNGVGYGPKHDIYRAVAEWVMERLKQECLSDAPERAVRAEWWLGKGVTRAMAKKPVMTFCYSATARSAAEHIFECCLEDFKSSGGGWRQKGAGYKDCLYLAGLLFEGIHAMFPKAAEAMEWMRGLAKTVGNRPIRWETPMGMIVHQDCRAPSIHKITMKATKLVFKFVVPADDIDIRKTLNSISPDFIHSMDAAHMMGLALRMSQQGCSLLAIHDCAATHPCDVPYLHKQVREVFFEMYQRDALTELRDAVLPEYDDPPTRGTLDLSKVLESEFFFS